MPEALLYLGIMLLVICIWFIFFKRPIYEAVLLSFIVLVAYTNSWQNILGYINTGLQSSLIYAMIAFVAMSQLMSKTKVVDSCILLIMAVFGRITGGAGYASIIASSFMGALSGSGPGNVMSTGVITIPAMKKSGFPAELAANVESTSSYLGNMIPPSSNIVAALGAYLALFPDSKISIGQFWVILWGIAVWFIFQRIITLYLFCKYYYVVPLNSDDLPDISHALKKCWKELLLPPLILLPFIIDVLFKDSFIVPNLGVNGARYFSSSILLFIAGVASFYNLVISREKFSISDIANHFSKQIKGLVPAVCVCLFGYMIGAFFASQNVSNGLSAFIMSFELGKFGMVCFLSLLSCFLGMIIPGSSLVVMFGPLFITIFGSVGVDPLLAAAMLPCICGTMCGITPPLALGMYAGMAIAESDFKKTVINDLWWVAGQFFMEVVVLMGWLPIIGL